MKGKRYWHSVLLALSRYFTFFLLVAFVITCCLTLFLNVMADSLEIVFSEENISLAAKVTFWNVMLISLLFTVADAVRRRLTVDRPVKRISKAAETMIQGNFDVRIPTMSGLATDGKFNEIIECINHMAKELSGVETLRTDFIANVSHEMKTPLAVMQNYGKLLQAPDLSEEKRKALLFPHIAVMVVLLPIATAFLVYSMAVLGSESATAVVSYVLAAYTLTVWCFRVPDLIRFAKTLREENRYVIRWREDERLRVNCSLFGSLLWNTAYGMLQLWLGYVHHTFWFYSLAGYYISLAAMRFFLVRHTRRFKPGEERRIELLKYRACGWIFLIMNLALALIIFFMVYWNRTFRHHEITAIMMAAYTFSAFTIAIVNVVRYRKYNSPVYSASKAISFAAACVSMLTLSAAMLTAFSDESVTLLQRKLALGAIGGVVSAVVMGAVLGFFGNTAMLFGILIGMAGGILAALAYPSYHWILARERKRIAPEIIRLTDELMK